MVGRETVSGSVAHPLTLSLEQVKTEEILAWYALIQGVIIERGIECIQVVQSAQETEVILCHTESGKEERIKAWWHAAAHRLPAHHNNRLPYAVKISVSRS